MNCSKCEKCFITILPLIALGLNPNNHGFKIEDNTFESIKSMILGKKLDSETIEPFWMPFQKYVQEEEISNSVLNDLKGAKDFFTWFKEHDLLSTESDVWFYRDLYYSLPFPVSKILDEIYTRLGVRIHDHSPIRRQRERITEK